MKLTDENEREHDVASVCIFVTLSRDFYVDDSSMDDLYLEFPLVHCVQDDDKPAVEDTKNTDDEDKMPDYDEETKLLIAGLHCVNLPFCSHLLVTKCLLEFKCIHLLLPPKCQCS